MITTLKLHYLYLADLNPPLPTPQLWAAGSPEGFFTHIFVDEAGHAEDPLLLCALAGHANRDGSTKVVLAGESTHARTKIDTHMHLFLLDPVPFLADHPTWDLSVA